MWLSGKESNCQAEDTGLERSPGEGNGNPLQYSCLGNPMNREAWLATIRGVTKSQTRLRNQTTIPMINYLILSTVLISLDM